MFCQALPFAALVLLVQSIRPESLDEQTSSDKPKAADAELPASLLEAVNGCEDEQCAGAFLNYYRWLQAADRPRLAASGLLVLEASLVWLLFDTAQLFVAPCMMYWTNQLKLSPQMAGATLLAISNATPDFATALVSASRKDLPLSLSQAAGSNLFSITCSSGLCLAICIADLGVGSYALDVRRYRELLLLYLLGLSVLCAVLWRAKLDWSVSLVPLLYVFYLIRLGMAGPSSEDLLPEGKAKKRRSTVTDALDDAFACMACPDGRLEKIIWAFTWPVNAMRLLTIPPVDQKWSREHRIVSSISPAGILCFSLAFGYVSIHSTRILLILAAAAICIGAWLFAHGATGIAMPKHYFALTVVSFIACSLWVGAITKEAIAILETFMHYLQISRMRLGFTIMSWGNCLGDIATCTSLVMAGQASIAFSGIVSCAFFNATVSLGSILIFITANAHGDLEIFSGGWPAEIYMPLLACLLAIVLAAMVLLMATYTSFVDLCALKPWSVLALFTIYFTFVLWMWTQTEQDVQQQKGATASML